MPTGEKPRLPKPKRVRKTRGSRRHNKLKLKEEVRERYRYR